MRETSSFYKTPPMCGSIRVVTFIIAAIPFLLIFFGPAENRAGLTIVAMFFFLLIIGVWLWMRPTQYIVDSSGLTVVWPLRKYHIPRSRITRVRVLDKKQVKKEIGFAVRIGVGGLFGGFGLLWSRKRGFIRFYITRTDDFVIIEQRNDRPLLITVDNPQGILKDLASGQA
jgi:hypothetical protein